ncbi:Nischarin [Trichinella pseudospiralis]|uniref:Nischarin n=1 Tax=Trichinella pseudospiralis TaxID=6337 RepID=A0A0V1ITZ3_TRIPS|nr:Nischarin [Trichinella pseudospiralis]
MMALFSCLNVEPLHKYCQITKYANKEDYIVYTVRVNVEDVSWTLDRRYSEFDAFDRAHVKCPGFPSLPPKKVIGNQDVNFLNQRKVQLEKYINSVFIFDCMEQKAKGLASLPRLIASFLHFNRYEIHSIIDEIAIVHAGSDKNLDSNFFEFSTLELHAVTERFKMVGSSFGCSPDFRFDFGQVAEFIANIKKLKISGNKCTGTSDIRLDSLTFDLMHFKSLQHLWICYCDASNISGMEFIAANLSSLTVHNTLDRISELLSQCGVDEERCENLVPWPQVKSVDFSFNNLCQIDASITALRYVHFLDLACNCLTDICNLQHLPYLRELNLSNNRIEKIEDWHLKLGNVKKIWLVNNRIRQLKGDGLSKLYSLEFLDLRDNQLSQIGHIWPLGQLPCLHELLVSGNTAENVVDYRTRILEAFGSRANELRLDNEYPTQRELDTIAVRLAIREAKEDRRRQLLKVTEQISRELNLAEAEVLNMPKQAGSSAYSEPKR